MENNQERVGSDVRLETPRSTLRNSLIDSLEELTLAEFFLRQDESKDADVLKRIVALSHALKHSLIKTDWSCCIRSEAEKILTLINSADKLVKNLASQPLKTPYDLDHVQLESVRRVLHSLNNAGFYYQSDVRGLPDDLDIFLHLMKSNASLVCQPLSVSSGVERQQTGPIQLDMILPEDADAKFYEINYGSKTCGVYEHTRYMGLSSKWFFVIDKDHY